MFDSHVGNETLTAWRNVSFGHHDILLITIELTCGVSGGMVSPRVLLNGSRAPGMIAMMCYRSSSMCVQIVGVHSPQSDA
jgi:hypothetical protein